MQNRFKIMILSLVLGFGLVGCQGDRNRSSSDSSKSTADSTRSSGPTATAPSESSSTAMSNSDLENAIKSKLQSDDQLRTAKIDVNANANKKEVTLSGTVPSQDLRTRAVELAKSAQPDVTVNDKIDVKPAA